MSTSSHLSALAANTVPNRRMDLTAESNRTSNPLISVVLPCLDEEQTLKTCITKAQKSLRDLRVTFEIVISDNGSTDRSVEIATNLGARVVHCSERGYGSAIRFGILAAKGTYVIVADADDSYALHELKAFVEALQDENKMVIGNRFAGGIQKGAMPVLNRYLGNPGLTGVLNLLFQSGIGDAHCGLRGFNRDAFIRMNTKSTGMEFASETVVLAARQGLRLKEVPTTLALDGRNRSPHLRPLHDGMRHLIYLISAASDRILLGVGLLLFLASLLLICMLYLSNLAGNAYESYFYSLLILSMGFLGCSMIAAGVLLTTIAKTFVVRGPIDRFGKWISQPKTLKWASLISFGLFLGSLSYTLLLAAGEERGFLIEWVAISGLMLCTSVSLLGVQVCQRFIRLYRC